MYLSVLCHERDPSITAKAANLVDKKLEWAKDYDFEALSRGCDNQLNHYKALLDSRQFVDSLFLLILSAKQKLAPGYVQDILCCAFRLLTGTREVIYYTGYLSTACPVLPLRC